MKLKLGFLYTIFIYLFITVQADTEAECLTYCERACNQEFIPKLVNLLNTTTVLHRDYNKLDPHWTTCQYRCYRCHLPGAIRAMTYLKNLFDSERQSDFVARTEIATVIDIVNQSVKECYSQWKAANEAEDLESTFY